ncbi:type I-E CRISPR-associated protein Cas6/Cse3/CasE, partial [Armatimonas sp.]|uniref:type I-E CRISPR-associated protein Cas6/Cse3/CasE n=1 Tax=Armatimonas sp. TaxID=1872638 RepID=UPI003750D878
RQVESDLRALYELHRTLSHAFPELPHPLVGSATAQQAADEARKEVRCLFRVEESPRHGTVILVQSRVEPDWEKLTAQHPTYLLASAEVKQWEPKLARDTPLRFRLRANPTVKREGKRLPLRTEEQQLEWIGRQASSHGFSLPLKEFRRRDGSALTLPYAEVIEQEAQKHHRAESRTTHHAVLFEGVLTVTDTALFAEALAAGIGAAKGFGFGLLSVARA